VYGGVYDTQFEVASRAFFAEVRAGVHQLVSSPVVEDELDGAPAEVLEHFRSLLHLMAWVEPTADSIQLQQAYLAAGILSERSAEDALHVALASLSGCDMIVSWNFKHIVHADKVPRYNAVNVLQGLRPVGIYSPAEVIGYAEGL
jgi:hypothetical protein